MSAAAMTKALERAVDELRFVTPIVQACLASMTSKQKADVHAKLAAAGVSPGGLVRANEREAVIIAGAAALAAVADTSQVLTISLPYSTATVKLTELEEQAAMRTRQAAGVLRLMPDDLYSVPMMQLARRLADDLVATMDISAALLLSSQLTELLRLSQTEEGACTILWLAMQLSDEAHAIYVALDGGAQMGVPA